MAKANQDEEQCNNYRFAWYINAIVQHHSLRHVRNALQYTRKDEEAPSDLGMFAA